MRKLDPLDVALLAELKKDGSISNKNLSKKLEVPATTCLERVRRLHQDGFINGIHADINYKALGLGLQAMAVIRLKLHPRKVIEQFEKEILDYPEVISLYHIGGENDFLVHLCVRDSDHLREFSFSAFTDREEVAHLETLLVFETKRSQSFPLLQD